MSDKEMDFPELPEEYVWAVREDKVYSRFYLEIRIVKCGVDVVRVPLKVPAVVAELEAAVVEREKARSRKDALYSVYEDAWFPTKKMYAAYEAATDEVSALSETVEHLRVKVWYSQITAEILLAAVPTAVERFAEVMKAVETQRAKDRLMAESRKFVGEYPPLSLSKLVSNV